MERLSKRISESLIELSAKANPIQYNGSPQRVHVKHPFWNVFNRLCAYEDAEEQGLLLRLPVPEGAVVYTLSYIYECKFDYDCKEFDAYKCEEDIPCKHQYKVYRVKETKFQKQMLAMLGKTVFLTKEEAEQALTKMKEV